MTLHNETAQVTLLGRLYDDDCGNGVVGACNRVVLPPMLFPF